jgi:hypothetical protein
MTAKLIWICDGCDEQKEVKEGTHTSDWRLYEISLTDAKGYPICHSENTMTVKAHLCPNCATRMAANIQPRRWARSSVGPSSEPTPAVPS